MMRLLTFSWSLLGAPAFAAEDSFAPEPEEETGNGFSGKVELSAAYDRLFSHSMYSAGGGIALGAQFYDIGALHGMVSVHRGATDGGLAILTLTAAPTWEFIFGRVRPGFGVGVHHFELEGRTTNNYRDTIVGLAFLTVDVVQSPYANVYAGARGDLTELDGHLLGGARLTLAGGRFKVP